MDRFQGRSAFVTGGARGIGAAIAGLFAREGARVLVADRDHEGATAVALNIGKGSAASLLDVSDRSSWDAAVEYAERSLGPVDILVNCASIYQQKSFEDTDEAAFDAHYRVNALGTFLGMKAVVPMMKRKGKGAVINISSGAALHGYPGLFAYAASKWMVRGISKGASHDLARQGIRVNTIVPGLIDTPMLADNTPEYLAQLAEAIPLGRLGKPEEIARLALFLASDEADYVTGAEYSFCGGLTS